MHAVPGPAEFPSCAMRLQALLKELQPSSVLLAGDWESLGWHPPEHGVPECRSVLPQELPDLDRVFDLALLAVRPGEHGESVAGAGPRAVDRLVARLRDCHARELLLVVSEPAPPGCPRPSELPGLGLRSWTRCLAPDGGVVRCYRHSRRTARPAPRWLNSRYWAHPERFGRCRW